MPITPDPCPPRSGLERVRHELLTALHFGKLSPGDRAPSVRRLADLTGMNRKTVHRAYTQLAREGLLDLRPGSGTYIAESAPVNDLLDAVGRCRAVARELGLEPSVFSSFLDIYLSDGLRDLPLAVVECSLEQVGFMSASLRADLGVHPHPLLLSRLGAQSRETLRNCRGIVTTEFQRQEVRRRVDGLPLPVFRVALDTAFPRLLLEHAEKGPVVIVVRDKQFEAGLRRAFERTYVKAETLQRLKVLEPAAARAALRSAPAQTAVYRSPLVRREALGALPRGIRTIPGHWQLDSGSLERLKAALALDVASRHAEQIARTA